MNFAFVANCTGRKSEELFYGCFLRKFSFSDGGFRSRQLVASNNEPWMTIGAICNGTAAPVLLQGGLACIYSQIQRVTPKKAIHSVLQLKLVVEVGFNFSTGVSESEFRAQSN